MNKSFSKFMALSFTAAASFPSPAFASQQATAHLAVFKSEPVARVAPCASQDEIDRGWERQRELLEARLSARGEGTLRVPGAIIASPFDEATPKASVAKKEKTEAVGRVGGTRP